MHRLDFISSVHNHEPPDFRTTWCHFLRSRNKSAFCNLQASIIHAIAVSTTNCSTINGTAPFWWLLLHLDMLIFAPSTHKQHFDYIGKNCSAQLAADNDEYHTAASLTCSSQSIAIIGSHNISHVNKLYTQQVPPQNHQHPTPSPSSQPFSLPGNICKIILHATKNKGAGINADTIDLFTTLIKFSIPTIKPDLHFIFNLIYTKTSSHNASSVILLTSIYSVSTKTPKIPLNSAAAAFQQQSGASLQAALPKLSVTSSHPTSSHSTMQSVYPTDATFW